MDIDAMRRGAEAPKRVDASDLDLAAKDLSDAFVEDPHVSWFVRNDARRDKARLIFFHYVLKNLALRDGEITRPAAGGAAAVWIPSEAWGSQFWLDEVRALPVLLATTGLGRFGRLLALRNAMDKHHPTDRAHEYLWFLGVTPSGQGHGIGSRLLKSKLDQLEIGRAHV